MTAPDISAENGAVRGHPAGAAARGRPGAADSASRVNPQERVMYPRPYPVQFSVDYPDRKLDRLTTFFRIFVAIPILIVLASVDGSAASWSTVGGQAARVAVGTGGALIVGPALMIIFRAKYPRWWFDWNLELQRFGSRVFVFLALMDDTYPSTDEYQAVHLDYAYP